MLPSAVPLKETNTLGYQLWYSDLHGKSQSEQGWQMQIIYHIYPLWKPASSFHPENNINAGVYKRPWNNFGIEFNGTRKPPKDYKVRSIRSHRGASQNRSF